jgi:hypothetical protein
MGTAATAVEEAIMAVAGTTTGADITTAVGIITAGDTIIIAAWVFTV